MVAVGQYSKLYAHVAREGLKSSYSWEICFLSNCSSGESKLVGSTLYGTTITYTHTGHF